jgi:hypothetical protein
LHLPHSVYIFQEPGSGVEAFAPEKLVKWLAFLYVNRQIACEASAVLYAQNHFHLVDITEQQAGFLHAFLNCIGSMSAAAVAHISINFPFGEEGLHGLCLLQDCCTNLRCLEAVVHRNNADFFAQPDNILRVALHSIDIRFRAMAKLRKIFIRFHSGGVSNPIQNCMQELGWKVVFSDAVDNRRSAIEVGDVTSVVLSRPRSIARC